MGVLMGGTGPQPSWLHSSAETVTEATVGRFDPWPNCLRGSAVTAGRWG